jgi:hypothetical protein
MRFVCSNNRSIDVYRFCRRNKGISKMDLENPLEKDNSLTQFITQFTFELILVFLNPMGL